MHRGKGMSFDPNEWQISRPGKRVCNERIISMYGITATATLLTTKKHAFRG